MPNLPYHGEQFADDLIVLAGEQPRPPVLVAASMGGLFGLLAESRWPGLFSAMVLVDITPRWDTAGVERILAFMTAHPDGFASLTQAADVISAYMPHRPRKSEQSLRALLREDGRPLALALGSAPGGRTGPRQRAAPGCAGRGRAPGEVPAAAGQRRPQRPGHAADRGRIPGVGAARAPCTAAAGHAHGRRR
jgi:pimeloyl-ACP methyl ester carboxylesterase